MWSLRLKKKTNIRVPSFSGVVNGGCVRTRKTRGEGDNFWLVNTCKAGEWFTCNCLSTWALFSWTTSTTHWYHIIIINSSLIIFFLHWSESKIFKPSEDTTRRSEGSDGNTSRLTAGLPSSSKNTASNRKNQTTTSKKKRKKKRKRKRKKRTPKECIRDPPEFSRTRPSKHADLPVDLLLLKVKNGELLACYSELKKTPIYYVIWWSWLCVLFWYEWKSRES